jgi:hypothetical protein
MLLRSCCPLLRAFSAIRVKRLLLLPFEHFAKLIGSLNYLKSIARDRDL